MGLFSDLFGGGRDSGGRDSVGRDSGSGYDPQAYLDAPYTVMVERVRPGALTVIKTVRELSGMSLAEAKAFVETVPHELGFDTLEQARAACVRLAEAGALARVCGDVAAAAAAPGCVVILDCMGPEKIQTVRVVRALTGLSLVWTDRVVESAPFVLPAFPSPEEAAAACEHLAKVGAVAHVAGENAYDQLVVAQEPAVAIDSIGLNKIAVIKAVREVTGLGLVEAKRFVEALPAELEFDTSCEARRACDKLIAAGAAARVVGVITDAEAAASGASYLVADEVYAFAGDEAASLTVLVEDFGRDKILAIKVVRELTGMGLAESKQFVETLPHRLTFASAAEAQDACGRLTAAGSTAHLG